MPADTYTPGCGARTLEPVAGMLYRHDAGFTVRCIAAGEGVMAVAWEDGGISAVEDDVPVGDHTPDLTDPATWLLALSALARRLGLDPTHGVRLRRIPGPGYGWEIMARNPRPRKGRSDDGHGCLYEQVPMRTGWGGPCFDAEVPGIDTDDAREALDRALWATRGVERG